jgi:hypothetical protein
MYEIVLASNNKLATSSPTIFSLALIVAFVSLFSASRGSDYWWIHPFDLNCLNSLLFE